MPALIMNMDRLNRNIRSRRLVPAIKRIHSYGDYIWWEDARTALSAGHGFERI